MSQSIKEGEPKRLTMTERIADAESRAGEKADKLFALNPNGLSLQLSIPVHEVLFELRRPDLKPQERLAAWESLNSIYDRILDLQSQPHR